MNTDYLMHYGIQGQKWGIRNYQNYDGTLTEEGKRRYSKIETFTGKDHKKYAVATCKPERVDPTGYGVKNQKTGKFEKASGVVETEVHLFDVNSGNMKGAFTLRNIELGQGVSLLVGEMAADPTLLKKGKDTIIKMKDITDRYASDVYKRTPIYM